MHSSTPTVFGRRQRQRGRLCLLKTAKLSASVIVSRWSYIALCISHDVSAPFSFASFFLIHFSCSSQYLCLDATKVAFANLCADELVPCGGHLDNQGYLMRPRGRRRRGGAGARKKGRKDRGKACWGVWGGGENRRQEKKTMRQNQKINEALFQWQDLCTVNISLAIRGNPITLCLSSPFSLWGRK